MFDWKPEYILGIPQIDDQHKQVFATAGELRGAMLAAQERSALGALLRHLLSISRAHFDTEEAMMQQSGCPEYPRHKEEHDELSASVRMFQQSFDAGAAEMTPELIQFLDQWLIRHITGLDRRMASHLRARAASA